jgi:hypothetical protein
VNIQVARFGDGFFAVWRDVTESDRVRNEREQLAAALEQASDGVVIVKAGSSIVTYANPAFISWPEDWLTTISSVSQPTLAVSTLGPDGLAKPAEDHPGRRGLAPRGRLLRARRRTRIGSRSAPRRCATPPGG